MDACTESAAAIAACVQRPGADELGHLEMVGTIVHQLTRNLSEEQIRQAGFDAYFVDHTTGVYPTAASGFPWSAASMQVKGDLIADLTEDLAADAAYAQTQPRIPSDKAPVPRKHNLIFHTFALIISHIRTKIPAAGKKTRSFRRRRCQVA